MVSNSGGNSPFRLEERWSEPQLSLDAEIGDLFSPDFSEQASEVASIVPRQLCTEDFFQSHMRRTQWVTEVSENPYGQLASLFPKVGKCPFFHFLKNTCNFESLYCYIKNHSADVTKGLKHESEEIKWMSHSVKQSFIEHLYLAFLTNNESVPKMFLIQLLELIYREETFEDRFKEKNLYPYIFKKILHDDYAALDRLSLEKSGLFCAEDRREIATVLTTLACLSGNAQVLERISPREFSYFKCEGSLYSPLEWLAIRGDLAILKKLKSFTNRNFATNWSNSQALSLSVEYNRFDFFLYCLTIECLAKNIPNVIILAIRLHRFPYFEKLLASMCFSDKEYSDFIMASIEYKNFQALKELLSCISVERLNEQVFSKREKTPIFYAVEIGFDAGLQLLLEGGADPTIPNSTGELPLHLAFRKNSKAIQKLIIGGGSFQHTYEPDQTGESIFDIAYHKDRALVEMKHFKSVLFFIFASKGSVSYPNAIKHLHNSLCKIIASGELYRLVTMRSELTFTFEWEKFPSDSMGLTASTDPQFSQSFSHKLNEELSLELSLELLKAAVKKGGDEEIMQLTRLYFYEEKLDIRLLESSEPPLLFELIKRRMFAILKHFFASYPFNLNICDANGRNALHYSIFYRDVETAHFLIDNFPHVVHLKDKQGLTPLHVACLANNSELALDLMNHVSLVAEETTCNLETPIHFLALSGVPNEPLLQRMLAKGFLIDGLNIKGLTPLHLACHRSGSYNMIKLLLKNGASPCIATPNGKTLLHLICLKNKTLTPNLIEILGLLESMGIDINARDIQGYTAFHYALNNNSDLELITKLLEMHADPKIAMEKNITPLHIASGQSNFAQLIPEFIKRGVDLYAEDELGKQPIDYALRASGLILVEEENAFKGWEGKTSPPISSSASLKALLQGGIEISKCRPIVFKSLILLEDEELFTLALDALGKGSSENAVKAYLEQALIILSNGYFLQKTSPLTSCEYFQKYSYKFRMLCARGVDIDVRNKEGKTILQRLCERPNNHHAIATLLHWEANFNLPYPNKEHETPYTMILERYSKEVGLRNFMHSYDVILNPVDSSGNSYLHHALKRLFVKEDKFLYKSIMRMIKQGADFTLPNRERVTPLHLMCRLSGRMDFDLGSLSIAAFLTPQNINLCDNQGFTPFLEMCLHTNDCFVLQEIAEKNGADLQLVTVTKESALHLVAKNKKLSSYNEDFIAKARMHLLAMDSKGYTPVEIALKNNLFLATLMLWPIKERIDQAGKDLALPLLQLDLSSKEKIAESEQRIFSIFSQREFSKSLYGPVFELFAALGKLTVIQQSLLERLKQENFEELCNDLKAKGYRSVEQLFALFFNTQARKRKRQNAN